MKPAYVVLAERTILLIGFVAVVASLAAIDWRLGLFVAGALLIVSTSPWKELR